MVVHFYASASVSIVNTVFAGGVSDYGGGLFVEYHNSNFEYSLSILNSTFDSNVARRSGGAMYMSWDKTTIDTSIHVTIMNTIFKGNSLQSTKRGGVALSTVVANCNPVVINLTILECRFSNSSGMSDDQGVIFLRSIPHPVVMNVIVEGSTNASAILTADCNIIFSGSSRISNNTAQSGAGLYLTSSTIHFAPESSLTITGNSAQQTGGGILIDFSSALSQCFYEMPDSLSNTVNFTVENNSALLGGDNIYGDLSYCDEFLQHVRVPQNEACRPSSIASDDPVLLCNGILEEGDCNGTSSAIPACNTDVTTFTIYPGGKLTLFQFIWWDH